MTNDAVAVFQSQADGYEARRRMLIPPFDAAYARWHERRSRALGATDEEWRAAEARMAHDRCASVEDQLGWLRAVDFDDADCLFKDHRFAVILAR